MDLGWLTEFPEELRLPLADWVDRLVAFLLAHFGELFAAIRSAILFVLLPIERALLALPWSLVVVLLAVAAWRAGGWRLAAGVTIGLVAIASFGTWTATMITAAIVVTAVVVAVTTGIPLGIAMARSARVSALMRPVLDFMQTLPSFVYLVPIVMLFRIGRAPALIAVLVYAIPPVIRLTELGIRQVPGETVEAAAAFGSTPAQMLRKVELPLAFPTIMAGVNQTTMMALAMVIVASLVGAPGLGEVVLRGLGRQDVGLAFVGGIAIVILAMVMDRMTQAFAGGSGVARRSTGA
ncbi:MAG TPA: ABC transporter permease subunit [Egibacteraceae bacterium]|jgi:glycine betaine/proline transport system permease protein|nr:ABC transporter permease subunit [Egibacteraceae bacterium]